MAEPATVDTPVAPDTQPAVSSPAPGVEAAPAVTAQDSILSDLAFMDEDKPAEVKVDKPVEAVVPPEDGEDEDIIRQRADYLKHKEKLNAKELELKAREEKLKELEGKKPEGEGDPPEPAGDFLPFALPFDPEKVTWDTDNERQLGTALKAAADEIAAMQMAIRYFGSMVLPVVQSHQQTTQATINTALSTGAKAIEEKYGVTVAEGDLIDAVKFHGERLYPKHKAMNADLVVEAWMRENPELIGKTVEPKTPTVEEKPAAPPMPGGGSTPRPVSQGPKSIAEQIEADLAAAGLTF